MKKHLDEGIFQALLDGELPPPERADAEAHLAACAACAAELRGLSAAHDRIGPLLALGDVPAPVAQAQMGVRRRRVVAKTSRFGEARWALLRAAALVLGLAGVAAASVPGSPVRAWIQETVLPAAKDPAGEALAPAPGAAPAPAAPAAEAMLQGASMAPENGSVRVELTGAAPGVTVRVRLTDRGDAYAYAPTASGARFRASPGTIMVAGVRAGEVTVELPRAGSAYLVVNGRVYAAKEGGALRTVAPADESSPGEPVFRVEG